MAIILHNYCEPPATSNAANKGGEGKGLSNAAHTCALLFSAGASRAQAVWPSLRGNCGGSLTVGKGGRAIGRWHGCSPAVPAPLAYPHGAAPRGHAEPVIGAAKGGTCWLWHSTGLSAASDSSSIHSPLTQSASPPAMISSFACVVLRVPSPTQARTLGRAYRNPGRARSTWSGGGSNPPSGR
jgi:hypothetical protein